MHSACIFWGTALTLALTPTLAGAQESVLDAKKAAARGAAFDVRAAIDYGRALRRAGHESEATTELRRASSLTPPYAPPLTPPRSHPPLTRIAALAVDVRCELARTAVAKREFPQAMAYCRSVAHGPRGATAGPASAAQAH